MSVSLPSLSLPGVLGLSFFGGSAALIAVHGYLKYAYGPTPEIRREGMDELTDVLIGAVTLGALYALLIVNPILPTITHDIASAIPVGNSTLAANLPPTSNSTALLQWSYMEAEHYFYKLAGFYSSFWATVISLSSIPWTAPLGWYAQQATWYLQTMVTYTLVNLGFLYALSLVAYNVWWALPLGIGLMIIRQTRSVGAFIVVFLTVISIAAPLLTAYTVAVLRGPIHQLSVLNPQLIITSGYPYAMVMQTYDVTLDIALALTLAVSYGLYRVFNEEVLNIIPI